MDFSLSKEQVMFKKEVIRFAKKEIVPRVEENDRNHSFDFEAFRKMGEFGLLGLHFPESMGGGGADVVTTVLAGEALGEAGVDGGLTLAYGAHTFLCADTLYCHGTKAQKEKFLPGLIKGELIGCMGLTEPDAGSDVASMKTTATLDGDAYVLNGSKTFITNGPIADVALIYAKTDPTKAHEGISAFLVERGTPGFSSGIPMHKLGCRTSQTSELFFSDCRIPKENLVGKEGMGFLMAMQTVEWDRSALLSPMIGAVTYALNQSIQYAKGREQFGRPIGKFYATKEKLASMKIFAEAARLLVYRIAWYKEQGNPLNHLEAAVAKLFVGDWILSPSNDAVLLHGGYGYCHEYHMERLFRDARLAPIGGGTSDIQKMIISKML
ncbi:MAG: acyl-CoA dehydrogenase family protein, partial [Desulfobacterales bacterium]|nr:acyl-CoA dehydrogenase family protein [Desulfobacterales bacterium]